MDEMQAPLKNSRVRLKVKAKCERCRRRLWLSGSVLICKNGHNDAPHVPVTKTVKGTVTTPPKHSKKAEK